MDNLILLPPGHFLSRQNQQINIRIRLVVVAGLGTEQDQPVDGELPAQDLGGPLDGGTVGGR